MVSRSVGVSLHATIEQTEGDMGVCTGVKNTDDSATACMLEASTHLPKKMKITGRYHTRELPWVVNFICNLELHGRSMGGILLNCRCIGARAQEESSQARVRKVVHIPRKSG